MGFVNSFVIEPMKCQKVSLLKVVTRREMTGLLEDEVTKAKSSMKRVFLIRSSGHTRLFGRKNARFVSSLKTCGDISEVAVVC
jgi:hypothetical protein